MADIISTIIGQLYAVSVIAYTFSSLIVSIACIFVIALFF
jgi:hypothetical protein